MQGLKCSGRKRKNMIFRKLFLVAVLFCMSSYSYAKEATASIILSSDMSLYKEVESGFNAFFAEKGKAINVKEHSLAAQDEKTMLAAVSAENPDIILAIGEAGLKSAKQMAGGIPIVFSMVFDASGYVNKNVTGVLVEVPIEMKIAGIRKAFPNAKSIGMLYSLNSIAAYKEVSAECVKQGLTLNAKSVNSDEEFAGAMNTVLSGSDCFLVTADVKIYFGQTVKFLLLDSMNKKVPVIGLSSFFTKAGAVMSFDSDFKDLGRQAGEIAARILSGENAGNIKPVRPRKYKYSLNLVTAEKIGITFPQGVVKDASEVFK